MKGGIKLVKVRESRRQSLRDCLGEDEDDRPQRSTSSSKPQKKKKSVKGTLESVTRGQAVVLHLQRHYLNFSLNLAEEPITCSIYKVEPIDAFPSDTLEVPEVIDDTAFRECPAVVTNYDAKSASSATAVQANSLEQNELVFLERFDLILFFLKHLQDGDCVTLEHDEAMKLDGARLWSTFSFTAATSEDIPEDWYKQVKSYGTPKTCGAVIAMDCLRPRFVKYADKHLRWMIHKAYAGFSIAPGNEVATGHWGCEGRKGNNHNVIFCIQSIAATLANKQLKYLVGSDEVKCEKGRKTVDAWNKNGTPLYDVFRELVDLCDQSSDFFTSYDPDAKAQMKAVAKELKAEEKAKAKAESMALGFELDAKLHLKKSAKGDGPTSKLLTPRRRGHRSTQQQESQESQESRSSDVVTRTKFKTDDYPSLYFTDKKCHSSRERSASLSPYLLSSDDKKEKATKSHNKLLEAPSMDETPEKKSSRRSKSLRPSSKSKSPVSDSTKLGTLRTKKSASLTAASGSNAQTSSLHSTTESRTPRRRWAPTLEQAQMERPSIDTTASKAPKVKTKGSKGRKVLHD